MVAALVAAGVSILSSILKWAIAERRDRVRVPESINLATRQGWIDAARRAAEVLANFSSGVAKLITQGPIYTDLEMALGFAKVVPDFAAFQQAIVGLPPELRKLGDDLIEPLSELLLALNRIQERRKDPTRIADLLKLQADQKPLLEEFAAKCQRFLDRMGTSPF